MIKALFLDRDGIINYDFGYVYKIEDFKFNDGIFSFCKLMQNKGYKIFVVTNQSGIARGLFKEEDFLKLTNWMIEEFKKEKIIIEDFKYCPDLDSKSPCRKPKSKMFIDLIGKHNIDPSKSISVGDKEADIIAAKNAGIKTNFLIKTKYEIDKNTLTTKVFKNIKDLEFYFLDIF